MRLSFFVDFSRQRKLKFDFQTRRVVKQFDIGLVKTSNGGDEAEPQPISWSASTPFEPVKSPKYVLTLVSGDAWAVVGDRNYGAEQRRNSAPPSPGRRRGRA
jgi:hypothetical protein